MQKLISYIVLFVLVFFIGMKSMEKTWDNNAHCETSIEQQKQHSCCEAPQQKTDEQQKDCEHDCCSDFCSCCSMIFKTASHQLTIKPVFITKQEQKFNYMIITAQEHLSTIFKPPVV